MRSPDNPGTKWGLLVGVGAGAGFSTSYGYDLDWGELNRRFFPGLK